MKKEAGEGALRFIEKKRDGKVVCARGIERDTVNEELKRESFLIMRY